MSNRKHPLEYVSITNSGQVIVNIPDNALYEYFDLSKLPEFIPASIVPFSDVIRVSIDIETTGKDTENDEIKYIGVLDSEVGYNYFYADSAGKDEGDILSSFFNFMHDRYDRLGKQVYLGFHNGFNFDLPFIINRAIKHSLGDKCCFYYPYKMIDGDPVKKLITFSTASLFSVPTQYYDIRYRDRHFNRMRSVSIIDTYHQLIAWDNINRKLDSRSLKKAPYQLKLIESERVELSYPQLLEAYKRNDHDLILSYLKDDLDATMLLIDFLVPDIHYQSEYFTGWDQQTLSTSGNATKWNSALMKLYGYSYGEQPFQADDPLSFQGGYTFGIPGLYKNVFKIDVSSLYPSVMLNYGIYSFDKDPVMWTLSMLLKATEQRLYYKELADTSSDPFERKEAKKKANSRKPIINSVYGMLGAHVPFNDYRAAALVTGYGQKIVKKMVELTEKFGGFIIECDTDGLIVATNGDPVEIHRQVQKSLPKGIVIKLEVKAEYAFISPSDKLDAKNTKNYLIFTTKEDIDCKGKYKKANRSKLEKTYQIELIKKLCYESKESAEQYHQNLMQNIYSGNLDLDLIRVTRKVAKNEKSVRDEGLTYITDEGVCMVTYYESERIDYHKRTGKALKPKIVKTNSAPYSKKKYAELIDKMYRDVMENIKFEL